MHAHSVNFSPSLAASTWVVVFCHDAANYVDGMVWHCLPAVHFKADAVCQLGSQVHLPAMVTIEGRYSSVEAYYHIAEMSIGQLCWLGP